VTCRSLLFTGRGGNGSWIVRGEQLGAACGGTVKRLATAEDCRAADLIVVVKRAAPVLQAVRSSGRPWVFDAVDFYPQPECGLWDRDQSIKWVRQQIKALNPTAVIWPTQRMQDDCTDGRPAFTLPHHHRPGIAPNPVREDVKWVGYEGRAAYLGGWHALIERECRRRGWRFTDQPSELADMDIIVAVRGDQWNSYAARHWKSNVKLANAHGSGTPFVGNPEWGYMETGSGCEYWVDDGRQLAEAFDRLGTQCAREMVSDRFRQKAYPVERAATDLLGFLDAL
jgi:hypothetical protein